ncbi:hypothetical protein ACFYOP_11970 [Streptomyces sp. NPDC006294]|uniref:hypothetical protein n=1 Tax=Streptomyces sp. NPDC006294 TaxID=3364743 RepID=UPI0036A4EBBE
MTDTGRTGYPHEQKCRSTGRLAGTEQQEEVSAVETRADTGRISSRISEREQVRTCRPAVVTKGREPDRQSEKNNPEPNIVRGED